MTESDKDSLSLLPRICDSNTSQCRSPSSSFDCEPNSDSDPILPSLIRPMEIELPDTNLNPSVFQNQPREEEIFPWDSNAIYFLLISLPFYLLNLPKFLWFEAEKFHRARHYLPQLVSVSFLLCLLEFSLFYSLSSSREGDGPCYEGEGSRDCSSLSLSREDFLCRGDFFRLFSHLFLHLNLRHLAANLRWQIWYCGYYNVLYGPRAFVLIWFAGGMYGAINHMLFREGEISGADASICAEHGAYLVWILCHAKETPPSFIRTYLRNCNFAIVAFYLLSVLWLAEDDRFCQFGGALMGLLLGVFLFLFRPLSPSSNHETYDHDHDYGYDYDYDYGYDHDSGRRGRSDDEESPEMAKQLQRTSLLLATSLTGGSLLYLMLAIRPATC